MPFTNFDNRHFTAAEKTAVNTAITSLETALTNKLANLSPEERQQYGSVNETNKLFVNKVKDYRDAQPGMSSPDIDWPEFMNDHDTRAFIQATIQRMTSILEGLGGAKILHDWDNYQAALSDYDYAKYKNKTNTIGYEAKVYELGQFFTSGSTNKLKGKQTGTE